MLGRLRLLKIYGLILLSVEQISYAQDNNPVQEKYVNPVIISFTNFHKSIDADSSAFQQDKLIVGLNFQINENWSGRFWFDVLRHDDDQNPQRLTPYVKPGYISYHKNKLTLDAGIMLTTQYKIHLQSWGNRYIYKIFQDKNSFGWSNDPGIRGKYEVLPNFAVEAGVLNGRGYRHVGISMPLKFTGALFYSPLPNLCLTTYSDIYRKNIPQSTLATLIDYRKTDKYSISFEYNYKKNYNFKPGHDRYGISAYSTIHFLDYFALISRVDQLYLKCREEIEEPIQDMLYLLGLQCQPLKQIRFAIDYQLWRYYKDLQEDEPWLYVHLEYRIM